MGSVKCSSVNDITMSIQTCMLFLWNKRKIFIEFIYEMGLE